MQEDNPTLEKNKDDILVERQGEVLEQPQSDSFTKRFYMESYGCAMNFSDTEIVASILNKEGYGPTKVIDEADLILVNTCSIREKAEENIRQRLGVFNSAKKRNLKKEKKDRKNMVVGVLGCMAERLKHKLIEEEKLVDIVVGPDAYRDLPNLIHAAQTGQKGVNVLLSREETYDDISPMRLDTNGVSAFISIMRGCDNMCSFCVVPFTRGRERSRNAFTVVAEAQDIFDQGYKEVTLLGQNVDSYKWTNPETNETVNFAQLMAMVAEVNPLLRVRFSTSHPKDITDEVLYTIRDYHNICNYIHLPAQSGNSRVLKLMNRTYDIEWYKERVDAIYRIIPDCTISSDMIAGFCTETEEEHQDTVALIDYAKYTMSYTFFYSERPGTLAARKYEDDIPYEVKKRRLAEIVERQREVSHEHNKTDLGKTFEVLIEGNSKKSEDQFRGRNSQNKMIIFDKIDGVGVGDYVYVNVDRVNSATLFGKIVDKES